MASVNRRIRPPSSLANSVLPNDSEDDESELSDVESPSSSPIGRSRFTQIAEDDEEEDEDEDAEGEEVDEDAEGEEVDDDEGDESEGDEEEEDEEADHDADENSPDDDDEEEYELEDEDPSESAASTPVPTHTVSRSRNARSVMSRPQPQSRPKSSLPPTPVSRSRRPPAPTSGTISKSKPTKASVLLSSTAHRLTLKMPKDKLRDATSGWASTATQSTEVSSSEANTPKNTSRRGGPRAGARSRRKVVEPSSDEEEDEEEEEDEDDVDMSDADADGIADDTMVTTAQQEDEESSEENPFGSDDEDMEVLPIGIQSIVSGTSTPDLARLTKRQRGRIDELYSADLMELPNSGFGPSPANKLHLTADEQALKRTEMARRRRNLTVQKLEEEKMETVNRLLYRQPAKVRGKPKAGGDETPAGGDDEDVVMEGGIVEKAVEESVKKDLPPNGFIRWTNRKEGSTLFVPNACLQVPPGRLYGGSGHRIEVMEEGTKA